MGNMAAKENGNMVPREGGDMIQKAGWGVGCLRWEWGPERETQKNRAACCQPSG